MPRAESARHAALLLHAMGAEDRQWLLAALAPAPRTRVQPLLQELQSLGIPADQELLRPVLAACAPKEASAVARLEGLDAAQAAALAKALLLEPRPLAARLLAMREWPWKAAVLAGWTAQQRTGMSAAPPAALSTALDRAICEAAVDLLASAAQSAAAPSGAARWKPMRWFRVLRAAAS